jgi:hypothetical protein
MKGDPKIDKSKSFWKAYCLPMRTIAPGNSHTAVPQYYHRQWSCARPQHPAAQGTQGANDFHSIADHADVRNRRRAFSLKNLKSAPGLRLARGGWTGTRRGALGCGGGRNSGARRNRAWGTGPPKGAQRAALGGTRRGALGCGGGATAARGGTGRRARGRRRGRSGRRLAEPGVGRGAAEGAQQRRAAEPGVGRGAAEGGATTARGGTGLGHWAVERGATGGGWRSEAGSAGPRRVRTRRRGA